MKSLLITMVALATIPLSCFGQDGSDISQAIPIYFGQTINDTIDGATKPWQVYSLALSKGQQVTVTVVASKGIYANLYSPAVTTVVNAPRVVDGAGAGITLNYQVSVAGIYHVGVYATVTGVTYTLQATAQGTPITSANPPQAGCLTGQVDYLTYSLQLIAAGLPDIASIGGTQMCPTCTVKPPAYPLLVSKMETAMGLNIGVSACYDASGSIFQIKLVHP